MNDKLNPCPFCGSDAILFEHPAHDWLWSASCSNYDCIAFQTRFFSSREATIEAWDRRA